MKRFIYLLLGYCIICIASENYRKVINETSTSKIKILQVKQSGNSVYIKIHLKDEETLEKILSNGDIEHKIFCRRGLPILFFKYKHRLGVIIGILIFFSVLFLSPKFIWEVNITGIDKLSYKEVEALLYDAGVNLGAFSPFIDRSQACSEILLNTDNISWISVNIRGGVANVEILERDYTAAASLKGDAANIVAKKDGYIIDTDIKRGFRIVKDESVVKKDELLVSGIYDTGKMVTRYVYSEARVNAIVNDIFTEKIPLKNNLKVYGKEIVVEKSIKIFGKTINISKNTSLNASKYDTIIREESFPFSLFDRLPVTVISVSFLPYTEVTQLMTDSEALKLAKKYVDGKMSAADYVEIISTEEHYFIENDILYFTRAIEAVQDIALTSEFNLN